MQFLDEECDKSIDGHIDPLLGNEIRRENRGEMRKRVGENFFFLLETEKRIEKFCALH